MQHLGLTTKQPQVLPAIAVFIVFGLLASCSSGGGDGTDNSDPGDPDDPVVLTPLPNPPLSAGPSAGDEPVPFDAVFHTVTGYPLVRDTGPRVESVIVSELTEADFAAGLPDPVITLPTNVDPASNAARFLKDSITCA